MQDSLGGNTKTLMVAAISPADYNFDETMSTLRYANRAKNIKNKPKINEDPKDAMLREYQEEIQRLKAQLMGMGGNEGGGMVTIDGQEININNIKGGVSEEYLKELQQKADLEKEEIKRRAEQEMKELMERQDATEGDKRALKEKLEKDLSDILMGKIPRQYGELPEVMGNYQRLAPGTQYFDQLMKVVGKMFIQSVK